MEHLPIFLSVQDQFCVVVGGGEIATRKVALLRRAGAHVQVVAPELCPNLAKLRDEGRIEHLRRGYRDGDLDEAYLAIAATDDVETNREVAAAGRSLRVPVNV
ncbi:MAG: bifunctional precorrin-2 dehydrogenase/sirohydrochlorin ferrochelatase, partial [Sedimenticolaceae bacterium]